MFDTEKKKVTIASLMLGRMYAQMYVDKDH